MSAILFVEEEGGLRDQLSSQCAGDPSFELLTCENPDIALELLEQKGTFQCVVADFGEDAPGCSAFLREVKERAPEVIRLALLAGPDGAGLPEIEVANQTLSRQIPAAELTAILNRAVSLAARSVQAPALTRLLSGFSKLPSAPTLYFELKDLLADPDSDNRQVAQLVASDPVVSARILKLANSAFYALPRTVTEIQEAVMYLGTGLIGALVLSIHIYRQFEVPGFNIEALWQHGMSVSALARMTARQIGCKGQEIGAASTAGLLHDLGQLVFVSNLPEAYLPLLQEAGEDEVRLVELEREAFGVDHAELCAHLLSLWGLPENVVEAVAGHHRPLDSDSGALASAPEALRIAEWMMHRVRTGPGADDREDDPDLPRHLEAVWESCLELAERGVEEASLA